MASRKLHTAVLALLLVMLAGYSNAQTSKRDVDSILASVATAPDSIAVKKLNELCWANRHNNPAQALVFGLKAEEIAERTANYYELSKAYSYLGVCNRNLGNMIDALEYYDKQINISRKHKIDEQLAWGCNNVANMYIKQKMYKEAQTYLDEAYRYADEHHDSAMLGYLHKSSGQLFEKCKKFPEAKEQYSISLDIRQKIHESVDNIASITSNIAGLYAKQRNYDSALYYYNSSLSYGIDTSDIWEASDVHTELAELYLKMGDIRNAESQALKAKEISEKAHLNNRLKDICRVLADILYLKGYFDEALNEYLTTINYSDSIYNSDLEQKMFVMEYNSSQYVKQLATDKLKYENQSQGVFHIILIIVIVASALFGLIMYRKVKKLREVSDELNTKQKELNDSIMYAQNLQKAVLPSNDTEGSLFSETCALYIPKEIVSGNFYWSVVIGDYEMVAIVEFPASGVSGGCLSMLGTAYLHELSHTISDPRELVKELSLKLLSMAKEKVHRENLRKGMPLALLSIHRPTLKAKFVGMGIPLIHIRGNHARIIHNTMPSITPENIGDKASTTEFQLQGGDTLYMSTDGYMAQPNPQSGKCISIEEMSEDFADSQGLTMSEQCEKAKAKLFGWIGSDKVLSDVCLLGMRIKKAALTLLLLLSFCQPGWSFEVDSKVDSLLNLVPTAEESQLPDIYCQLAWLQRITMPFSGLEYSMKAIEWSTKEENYERLQFAYVTAGTIQRNFGHYDEALEYYIKARDVAQEHNLREAIAYSYNNIGNILMETGNLKDAETDFKIALDFGVSLNNLNIQAYASQYTGMLYHRWGNNDTALVYLQKASDLWKQTGSDILRIMTPLRMSAQIYMETKQYQKAKDIYYTYLTQCGTVEYDMLSLICNNLCLIYLDTKQVDSAEYFANKSYYYADLLEEYDFTRSAYRMQILVQQMKGNMKDAAFISRKFADINDSLFSASLKKHSGEVKYTYNSYLKQMEYDKASSESRLSYLVSILGITMLVLVAIGVTLIIKTDLKLKRFTKNLKNEKQKVEENIDYAHSIQMVLQPSEHDFGNCFSDRFLLYMPKDIVSGDFYWKYEDDQYEMLAVADCTGHGVPGAMLTMLGSSELSEIAQSGEHDAGNMLQTLRNRIKFLLGINTPYQMQDGMDICLAVINKKTMVLDFSGAYNSLIYIRDGELYQLKANRNPIGAYIKEKPFTSEYLQLQKGDCIYMMSDGYISQFGGSGNSKFPKAQFMQMLKDNSDKPMRQQLEIYRNTYTDWQGSNEQVDDVTLAGFRV